MNISYEDYLTEQNYKTSVFKHNNDETVNEYLNQHPYQKKLATDQSFATKESCDMTYRDEFTDYIPANDPTSDNLLEMKKRPITDFYHNNMVPYAKKFTQNMAGTGVAEGNYIDGKDVNSGFDNTNPNQTIFSTYTGVDDTYLHKRETGPFFSPAEQQTDWQGGSMPLFRPDMDRFKSSLNNLKNDQAPVEKIMVGKGLNLDPSIPASGGFHDYTRILPNNVDNYKANQLSGRVITGKVASATLPTSYPGVGGSLNKTTIGVPKNKPPTFWDQARYPTMTTRVGFQSNLDYAKPDYTVDFRPKNADRDQISYGLGNLEYIKSKNNYNFPTTEDKGTVCLNQEVSIGQGPLGTVVPLGGARPETFMSFDNNIRSKADCNSQPIGAPQREGFGVGNILNNWYVNETDRGTVNPQNLLQVNLNAEKQGTTFYTYDDVLKTTTRETTEFSYGGNANREGDGATFYSYTDAPKTTNKETTEFSYASNPSRTDLVSTFYTYDDVMKTTNKETTEFSYAANPAKPNLTESSRFMFTGGE